MVADRKDPSIQRKPHKTDCEDFKRQISALSYFDICAWLPQRIYALNHSHAYQTPLITWKSLQNQMDSNYTET